MSIINSPHYISVIRSGLPCSAVAGVWFAGGETQVKPPPFEYERPTSLAEAIEALASHPGDARILAGGQSLVPLMNFRVLRPSLLVDVNRLAELDFIRAQGAGLRIGALTRHHTLETAPPVAERFPALAEAMGHVAHLAVRNRGTLGGSLAHADPAAELPMLALLLDAEIAARGPAGERRISAGDFFLGPLTNALADDEIITEIALPALPSRTGSAFAEVALRHGDFAVVAAAATVSLAAGGTVAEARLAVTGIGETPLRLGSAEAALAGERRTPELLAAASEQACNTVQPVSDLRASADYRRHLVGVLSGRVLVAAWDRAAAAAA